MGLFQGMRRPFCGPKPDTITQQRDQEREERRADALQTRKLFGIMLKRLETIMRTLKETLAAVEAESGSIASISTLLTGIKKQLDDALGGALTPSQQMRVDAIFNKATENKQNIDAAIKANDGITDDSEKLPTVTEASTSASAANVGDTLIFSAHVAGGPNPTGGGVIPTGTVSFAIDGNVIGTGSLDADGVGRFTTSIPIPAGDHALIASYGGDGVYQTSVSDPVQQSIVAPAAAS